MLSQGVKQRCLSDPRLPAHGAAAVVSGDGPKRARQADPEGRTTPTKRPKMGAVQTTPEHVRQRWDLLTPEQIGGLPAAARALPPTPESVSSARHAEDLIRSAEIKNSPKQAAAARYRRHLRSCEQGSGQKAKAGSVSGLRQSAALSPNKWVLSARAANKNQACGMAAQAAILAELGLENNDRGNPVTYTYEDEKLHKAITTRFDFVTAASVGDLKTSASASGAVQYDDAQMRAQRSAACGGLGGQQRQHVVIFHGNITPSTPLAANSCCFRFDGQSNSITHRYEVGAGGKRVVAQPVTADAVTAVLFGASAAAAAADPDESVSRVLAFF